VAVVEILKSSPRVHDCLEHADGSRQTLLQIMKESGAEGMQHFDGEIEKLVRAGVMDEDTALNYATDPLSLQLALGKA
jgi:twitching motility protein PilT